MRQSMRLDSSSTICRMMSASVSRVEAMMAPFVICLWARKKWKPVLCFACSLPSAHLLVMMRRTRSAVTVLVYLSRGTLAIRTWVTALDQDESTLSTVFGIHR